MNAFRPWFRRVAKCDELDGARDRDAEVRQGELIERAGVAEVGVGGGVEIEADVGLIELGRGRELRVPRAVLEAGSNPARIAKAARAGGDAISGACSGSEIQTPSDATTAMAIAAPARRGVTFGMTNRALRAATGPARQPLLPAVGRRRHSVSARTARRGGSSSRGRAARPGDEAREAVREGQRREAETRVAARDVSLGSRRRRRSRKRSCPCRASRAARSPGRRARSRRCALQSRAR